MKKDFRAPASSTEFDCASRCSLPAGTELFQLLAQTLEASRKLSGLHLADAAFVFSALFRRHRRSSVWLCLNNRQAEQLADNLRFFLPCGLQDRILVIPGSEADPYRGLSTHPEIAAKRALGLWRLLRTDPVIAVTTVASVLARLPSPASFLSHCLQLEVGNFLPLDHLLEKLQEMGYVREDPVSEVGEYSRRGGILDLFSPSRANPVRVEFFGDEIESLREFDPATQRSIELIPQCEIVPMREFLVGKREIARWHERAPEYWNEVRFAEALSEKLQFTAEGELFNGFEYLFPLVVETPHPLLDFLSQGEVMLYEPGDFWAEVERFSSSLEENFRQRKADGDLCLPPRRLFLEKVELLGALESRRLISMQELSLETQGVVPFDFRPERSYQGRIQELLADLENWRRREEQLILVMASRGLAERVVDIFKEYDIPVCLAEQGFEEALRHPLSVTTGKLSGGFYSPALKLHLLTQENLFEESRLKPLLKKSRQPDTTSRFLSDLRDLKEGDYVVHVDHGIGIFRGLKRLGVGKDLKEFVLLQYGGDARLYVPVDRVDLIQKYAGGGQTRPQIDRLGGISWERTKQRIKRSVHQLAEDLLKLYARRQLSQGWTFSPDDALMSEFEDSFEYVETPDQQAAIQDVKRDMESSLPMDRLICGDVGYGKTEVAMRAAFKALKDNKQVALLAPTTVLTFQHFNTFRERFRAFPVLIEMISRFRSRKEQADILERTAWGSVDILIGTHRLLSKDIKFRDLGLIVVDEEQRFGVRQKEKLKRFKASVDVLALSATPIPRTLNMSMIGLRDLSIIETPPKDRLAIQTVVVRFSRNIIRSALDLELRRQGQVFFLHNKIETIHSIARLVQETCPEARVAVAHGRLSERQLEEIMVDFVNYKYDVLVSTTIIENGLDIPRANTLIVNQADRFGLAQLYQLRGRVGRSNRRAYAYLLVSSEEELNTEARRRLAAIKEFSELGAGFRIAALDLEIRGAGNLLGSEQHGHISAVGLELYMKLLERSIREVKGEEVPEEVQTSIDLRLDIRIPEHYIDDPTLRLWLYKRILTAGNRETLERLKEEIVDRFGKYPRSVSNLFEYAHLKARSEQLKIVSLDRRGNQVFLRFHHDTPVSRERIVELVRRNGKVSLSSEGVLALQVSSLLPNELFQSVHGFLDELQAGS